MALTILIEFIKFIFCPITNILQRVLCKIQTGCFSFEWSLLTVLYHDHRVWKWKLNIVSCLQETFFMHIPKWSDFIYVTYIYVPVVSNNEHCFLHDVYKAHLGKY